MITAKRLLVVNADDFGLTEGTNRAIIRTVNSGVVTSTSVLPNGAAFLTGVRELQNIAVGIGVHLTVVGSGAPILSATEIPSLVDKHGKFAKAWPTVTRRAALRLINPDDLRREFAAQIALLRDSGLALTHLDTHQNVHLWPMIGKVVTDLAVAENIDFVRIPRTRRITPLSLGVDYLSKRLARRLVRAGRTLTDISAGFDEAGALEINRLKKVIGRLGNSSAQQADIVCHPGEADDPDLGAYSWGFRWAEETAALTTPTIRQQIVNAGFTLGTYRDLVGKVSRS